MPITNASKLADFASGASATNTSVIQVDYTNQRVGIGTTNPRTALNVVGVVSATSFSGNLTGTATTATFAGTATTATFAGTAYGLTGSPNITVGNIIGAGVTFTNSVTTETRFITVAEKLTRVAGNTVSLVYNSNSSNIGFATNPSGDITLAVTNIPTSSDFDNHVLTFSIFVNQTGTARSCTAITLNGVSRTIKWTGGSLSAAISGVTTTSGYDIYSFTGINTVGSASTAANYDVLGVVNGGFR
jgi:hypothetical protein